MKIADFELSFLKPKILLITDLCNPNKASLTNSLDIILAQLNKKIKLMEHTIIQRDSEGKYSQIIIKPSGHFSFRFLSEDDLQEAITLLK